MFDSCIIRKDTIHDIGIPVVLARAAGKRSTLGMLRGPQSWPEPGWGQGQGLGQGQSPLLPHQAEQDFSLQQPCTSVSGVIQRIHVWMDQYMDIPQG